MSLKISTLLGSNGEITKSPDLIKIAQHNKHDNGRSKVCLLREQSIASAAGLEHDIVALRVLLSRVCNALYFEVYSTSAARSLVLN